MRVTMVLCLLCPIQYNGKTYDTTQCRYNGDEVRVINRTEMLSAEAQYEQTLSHVNAPDVASKYRYEGVPLPLFGINE